MPARNATKEEMEENKKNHTMRNAQNRAARRSGKIAKQEGKVSKSKAKTKGRLRRSQKKIATVNKSRR